jgi:HK97 family phage major capsid protein
VESRFRMDSKQLLDELKQTWAMMQRAMENKADASTIAQFNNRLDSLEVKLQRPLLSGMAGPNYDPPKGPNKDLQLFLKTVARGGPQHLPEASDRAASEALINQIDTKLGATTKEQKALLLGDDTLGGFLAPPELAQEIIKGIQLVSPVRQYARVRETSNRTVNFPVRSGVFSAQWTAEAAIRNETTGQAYAMDEIPTNEMFALVLATWQDVEDSAFDLGADVAENAAEQFAKLEGTAFVNGTSVKQPEGFMTNAAIAADLSGAAGAITADSLISFVYGLKSGYARNAALMMNRKTLGVIRAFKDLQNRYLWEPNYQVGQPQTILGIPVAEVPDMDDIGATKFPVAIGDFRRGYYIVDRITMTLIKLNERYADQGMVGFLFRKRVGGQVVLPEAIRKLKSNNA